ncbi:MAG: hypothetical protein U0228_01675 [Myxococcaceae bacterium]
MASQTLSTTELLVIDGANGITRATREQFPDASWSLAVCLAALVASAWLARRAPRWIPFVLFLAAAPGLFHVFVARADAPLQRGATAAPIRQSLDELHRVAPWPNTPVTFSREEDDVTFPLTRYAVPARPPAANAVSLDVTGTRLPLRCTGTTCEARP